MFMADRGAPPAVPAQPAEGALERQFRELALAVAKFQDDQIRFDEEIKEVVGRVAEAVNEAGRQLASLHQHRELTNKNFEVLQGFVNTTAARSAQPAPAINVTVHEREPRVSVVNEIHPDDQARVTTVRRDAAGRILETISERKPSEVTHG